MTENGSNDGVTATAELSGDYSEIARIPGDRSETNTELDTVSSEMRTVLQIVEEINGATKIKLSRSCPSIQPND
jgi:hypothetical protein